MQEKKITCIVCPVGCLITVRGDGEIIDSIQGNNCKRGDEYARSEFVHPVRILTSSVKVEEGDRPLVSVRSDRPVPKERLLECMKIIRGKCIKAPISCYDVLIPDILGTGINIIATGDVKKNA